MYVRSGVVRWRGRWPIVFGRFITGVSLGVGCITIHWDTTALIDGTHNIRRIVRTCPVRMVLKGKYRACSKRGWEIDGAPLDILFMRLTRILK